MSGEVTEMASDAIREVEVAIEAALVRQRDELLAAVKGLLGLVQLVDSRDDMPLVLADNHRYVDALALVKRIEQNHATPSEAIRSEPGDQQALSAGRQADQERSNDASRC